jgi:hypothetical protein
MLVVTIYIVYLVICSFFFIPVLRFQFLTSDTEAY